MKKSTVRTGQLYTTYHKCREVIVLKNIEFVTRVQVNGVKEEISPEKAKEIILKRVQEALTGMNYEKKAG